jgi:hypothetical protein
MSNQPELDIENLEQSGDIATLLKWNQETLASKGTI